MTSCCYTSLIDLVQGDTRPPVIVQISDQCNGNPVDLSGATQVLLKFRQLGSDVLKSELTGTLLTGWENEDGLIVTSAPYDVAGAGGRVSFSWGATDLDSTGRFEGEIEITFGDGTVQTVLDILRFRIRPQFPDMLP